jgi:hypothetical protein
MTRRLFALALGLATAGFVATAVADEKKDTKLEGKLVCTKCKLKETEACGNAVVVKDGDKSVTYYLQDKGKGEKYHQCSGEKDVTVTGKVGEKDGKKSVEGAKVEAKK